MNIVERYSIVVKEAKKVLSRFDTYVSSIPDIDIDIDEDHFVGRMRTRFGHYAVIKEMPVLAHGLPISDSLSEELDRILEEY